jgi:hypothetical protein
MESISIEMCTVLDDAEFFAGPLGSLTGSRVLQAFGWSGVCALGLAGTIGATVLLVTALAHRAGSQTAPV